MRSEARLPTSRTVLAGATLVALVATAGSLYLSLGLGLVPCRLCWYQRIAMYPLTVVLGVAALENRPGAVRTAAPLAVIGAFIAAYHSYIQVAGSNTCTASSCSAVLLRVGGVFSIPNLSLVAFLLIVGLLVLLGRRSR